MIKSRAAKEYNVRPHHLAQLKRVVKGLPGNRVCHLYKRHDVLQVAQSVKKANDEKRRARALRKRPVTQAAMCLRVCELLGTPRVSTRDALLKVVDKLVTSARRA